jgi:hypothetical protein
MSPIIITIATALSLSSLLWPTVISSLPLTLDDVLLQLSSGLSPLSLQPLL